MVKIPETGNNSSQRVLHKAYWVYLSKCLQLWSTTACHGHGLMQEISIVMKYKTLKMIIVG